MTVAFRESGWEYGMALGDAHTLLMPLGPRYMVALGESPAMETVREELLLRVNKVQVMAAKRFVYFRPSERQRDFVMRCLGDRG
ncbi:hypothetical protein GCM10027168_63410 [Streptomyces capparidis]